MFEKISGKDFVVDLLRRTAALLNGHFELASGLHSATYIQCAKLFERPEDGVVVGSALANQILETVDEKPSLVVSLALGGVILGHEVARAMVCRHVFVERVAGKMVLRRGFDIRANDRVIVVEDVTTTGGSVNEAIQVVSLLGGRVIGIGAIVNRSKNLDFGKPFVYLVRAEIENFEPSSCPLCAQGVPVAKPGTKRLQVED
ncbi:MAG: orotate phosphoribosyltransferase [bacterium]